MLLRSHLKSSLADPHFASLAFNFDIGRRGFFVLFLSKKRPVWLSCFSLLLFFSAFHQIIAEPVDQCQSSGTEGESCDTWTLAGKQVLQYVQGFWMSAFTREKWSPSQEPAHQSSPRLCTSHSRGCYLPQWRGLCGILWELAPQAHGRPLCHQGHSEVFVSGFTVRYCSGATCYLVLGSLPCNILYVRPEEHTYLEVARLARTDN